ncbi:MAG: hypothetical protein U0804_01270 [Gemmataceae bacterium]
MPSVEEQLLEGVRVLDIPEPVLYAEACASFEAAGVEVPMYSADPLGRLLFARKQAEVLHGGDLKARYQLEGAGASQDVSTYAKRHYGFGVHFGRGVG